VSEFCTPLYMSFVKKLRLYSYHTARIFSLNEIGICLKLSGDRAITKQVLTCNFHGSKDIGWPIIRRLK
jgi:hypothetical protein